MCSTNDGQVVHSRGCNAPCRFPFKINDQAYSSCILLDEAMPWCSIEVDSNDNHVPSTPERRTWGYCDIKKCIQADGKTIPTTFHPVEEVEKTCEAKRICLPKDECPELSRSEQSQMKDLIRKNMCNRKNRNYCCPSSKLFECFLSLLLQKVNQSIVLACLTITLTNTTQPKPPHSLNLVSASTLKSNISAQGAPNKNPTKVCSL